MRAHKDVALLCHLHRQLLWDVASNVDPQLLRRTAVTTLCQLCRSQSIEWTAASTKSDYEVVLGDQYPATFIKDSFSHGTEAAD